MSEHLRKAWASLHKKGFIQVGEDRGIPVFHAEASDGPEHQDGSNWAKQHWGGDHELVLIETDYEELPRASQRYLPACKCGSSYGWYSFANRHNAAERFWQHHTKTEPWRTAKTAARGAGVAAGIHSWPQTQPWTWGKEQFAETPGWVLGGSLGGGGGFGGDVVARNMGDRIQITEAFFRLDPNTRKSTLYHEAGHDAASAVLAMGQSVWEPALLPFGNTETTSSSTKYDLVYGGSTGWGQNQEETLSDVYAFSFLYPSSFLVYDDPEWRQHGQRLKDLVRRGAQSAGLPTW